MDLNNRKMANHPPSPVHTGIWKAELKHEFFPQHMRSRKRMIRQIETELRRQAEKREYGKNSVATKLRSYEGIYSYSDQVYMPPIANLDSTKQWMN